MKVLHQQKKWRTIFKEGFMKVFVPFSQCYLILIVFSVAISFILNGHSGLENQQLMNFLYAMGIFAIMFSVIGGFSALNLSMKKEAKLNEAPFEPFKQMGFKVINSHLVGEFQDHHIALEWKQIMLDDKTIEAIVIKLVDLKIFDPNLQNEIHKGRFEKPLTFTENSLSYCLEYEKDVPKTGLITKRISEMINLVETLDEQFVTA